MKTPLYLFPIAMQSIQLNDYNIYLFSLKPLTSSLTNLDFVKQITTTGSYSAAYESEIYKRNVW